MPAAFSQSCKPHQGCPGSILLAPAHQGAQAAGIPLQLCVKLPDGLIHFPGMKKKPRPVRYANPAGSVKPPAHFENESQPKATRLLDA